MRISSSFRHRLTLMLVLVTGMFGGIPAVTHAHVKWFSDFSFADQPLTISEALTPTVWALLVLSMLVVGALVWVDQRVSSTEWYERLNEKLASYSDRSLLILRVGAGATLLLAWQGDAIFVPELDTTGAWVGWYQFALALLLLFRRTTPVSGVGLLLLYAYGFGVFSALHMLDYVFFAGVGFYFAVSGLPSEKIRALGLPVLYLTVGFSLCWVALEKLIYPQWGLYVLSENPQLALGFDLEFFLTGAAFVEFSLGYLLIICLLQRPLALVITLVFFTTTLVFGKVEVIGHTLIHAALIVFVIKGPGTVYRAPYTFHKRPSWRTAFASVNVALLFAVLLAPYGWFAQDAYETRAGEAQEHVHVVSESEKIPSVSLQVTPEPEGGYLVRLETNHFAFAPGRADSSHVSGEGHAHLYVDGRKVARLYAPVYHLADLPSGKHAIAATLTTNDHQLYMQGSEVIRSQVEVTVP